MRRRSVLVALAVTILAIGCSRPDGGAGEGRVVLQNKGSDTLVNVAQAWAEAYKDVNPDLAIAVTGGGSTVRLRRTDRAAPPPTTIGWATRGRKPSASTRRRFSRCARTCFSSSMPTA